MVGGRWARNPEFLNIVRREITYLQLQYYVFTSPLKLIYLIKVIVIKIIFNYFKTHTIDNSFVEPE